MPAWDAHTLVAIDGQYDRDNASDGKSRYGSYLRQNAGLFRDAWTDTPRPVQDPIEFAVHAWAVATGPIMAPGYVRIRPDLHRVTLHRDDYDGSLYAQIVVPLRHGHISDIGRKFPYSWRDWQKEHSWGDSGGYFGLIEPDPGKSPSVLAAATVRVPGHDWPGLITPTAYEGAALVQEAQEAVAGVVAAINADAAPIVAKVVGDLR
ncbi:hypothetical protein ACWD4O_39010 [Streptomyces sp. NPDC002623]